MAATKKWATILNRNGDEFVHPFDTKEEAIEYARDQHRMNNYGENDITVGIVAFDEDGPYAGGDTTVYDTAEWNTTPVAEIVRDLADRYGIRPAYCDGDGNTVFQIRDRENRTDESSGFIDIPTSSDDDGMDIDQIIESMTAVIVITKDNRRVAFEPDEDVDASSMGTFDIESRKMTEMSFDRKITVQGTSLMIPITKEARAMGLGRGDIVRVTLKK